MNAKLSTTRLIDLEQLALVSDTRLQQALAGNDKAGNEKTGNEKAGNDKAGEDSDSECAADVGNAISPLAAAFALWSRNAHRPADFYQHYLLPLPASRRAATISALGSRALPGVQQLLIHSLTDSSELVIRRAAEALVKIGNGQARDALNQLHPDQPMARRAVETARKWLSTMPESQLSNPIPEGESPKPRTKQGYQLDVEQPYKRRWYWVAG